MIFPKIVISLDGSQTAEASLRFIKDLACTDSQLLLVTVCAYPETAMNFSQDRYDEIVSNREERAGTYLDEVKAKMSEWPVTTSVRSGHPVEEILAACDSFGADLLALSSHGHSGVERWLLGSVAENAARRSSCPALVVRPTCRSKLGQKILVPLDGSLLAEQAIPLALQIARHSSGALSLLRAHTSSNSFEFMSHDIYPDRATLEPQREASNIALSYLQKLKESLEVSEPGIEVSISVSNLRPHVGHRSTVF